MGELERLMIRIEADTALLRRELAAADRQIGNFASSVDNRFRQVESRFASVGAMFGRVFGAYAIYQTIKTTVDLADTYTLMTNRLNTVTKSAEELAYVQERLQRTAAEARIPLREVNELYARMAFSLKNAGVSTNEVLEFTDNLSKSVVISGAAASEAAGALRQLSQGLASGTLRGQELNSVMEQLPILADLIATKMGVTIGELRKLGEEGKINGRAVFEAIIGASEELDAKFAKTMPTVGQNITLLGNRLLEFVGLAGQATGATSGLAGAFAALGDKVAVLNAHLKAGTLIEWGDIGSVGPGRSAAARKTGAKIGSEMFGPDDAGFEGFDPNKRGDLRGSSKSVNDPWNTTLIPPTAEEDLRHFQEVYAEVHDATMAMLEELIASDTLTVASKMDAITAAVKRGEIGWKEYGDMQQTIQQQSEDGMDALLSATSSALTSIFQENKTAAIAAATIDTYLAINKALATLSPPYSYAVAAISAAKGFAQVSRIRSMSKGSSGGGAASSGGSVPSVGGTAAPRQTLYVQGINPGQMFSGDAVRDIAQKLIDYQKNGGAVVLAQT